MYVVVILKTSLVSVKRVIRFFAVTACLGSLFGCTVDLSKKIEQDDPWTVILFEHGRPGNPIIIRKVSQKRQHLLVWARNNSSGWGFTFATYAPDLNITGTSFRLNVHRDFVVFGSGRLQYSKKISEGDYQRLLAGLVSDREP